MLLKDYDFTILYYPGMVNVVAEALSRKSMGSLTRFVAERRPLVVDIQSLANHGVRIDHTVPGKLLAVMVVQFSLIGQVKTYQYDDPYLVGLGYRVQDVVLSLSLSMVNVCYIIMEDCVFPLWEI